MFDEPVNGLDPEGVRWIRELMRALAAQGRAVLVSSHLMAEMAVTADHVVVVGRGRLIADTAMAALAERHRRDVLVRAADPAALATVLRANGGAVQAEDGLAVTGLDARRIGELAFAHGIALYELTPREASLEEAFMELTGDSREYVAR
jgi:ABC-2 type transport system ATP-binding protein